MKSEEIAIRTIQHYLYCPHRWGLLEIDKAWAENYFVTKANLLHERVHDPEKNYMAKGRKVYTSVPVYNDQECYNLYGVTDCLELTPAENGAVVPGLPGSWKICIVEYKPTKPKDQEYREDDAMQVFAQKLCVDYVFGGDCDGVIYYANEKKRVQLPLHEIWEIYDTRLKALLEEMRKNLKLGIIPPIRKGQTCSGCSMKDLCMPGIKLTEDLKSEIHKIEVSTLCENC